MELTASAAAGDDGDTAAAAAAVEDGVEHDEAAFYDYGDDSVLQQGEDEQEDPDSYEGYAWDEVTGQYYDAATYDGDAATYDEGGGEEPTPLTADIYDYGEEAEAVRAFAAPADSVEGTKSAELTSATTPKDSDTPSKAPPSSPAKKPHKKTKTKSERVQMRQEMLEREEEAKQQQSAGGSGAGAAGRAGEGGFKSTTQARPKPTFIEREKANIRLQIRKARAIARKRMPVQVRILTQTRQHLSPLEKYFGSRSIEAALSDIFWSSLKGDIRRVRHLVEIEHVSVVDSTLDPWNMQQTPLHWAAKGGSREVIEYLVGAGASVRCLDEAGDSRDLYIRDFDAALAPLDWASIRGHAQLLKAIEEFEDLQWLPKFVDDLVRGIIRYKIKLFKPPLRPAKVVATATEVETEKAQSPDAQAIADSQAAATADVPSTSPAAEPASASTK